MIDLRTAIARARRDGVAVQKDPVQFVHLGRPLAVRVEVRPQNRRNGNRRLDLLVVFQKAEPAPPAAQTRGKHAAEAAGRLERDLAATR